MNSVLPAAPTGALALLLGMLISHLTWLQQAQQACSPPAQACKMQCRHILLRCNASD
jgi:hypothetical protein